MVLVGGKTIIIFVANPILNSCLQSAQSQLKILQLKTRYVGLNVQVLPLVSNITEHHLMGVQRSILRGAVNTATLTQQKRWRSVCERIFYVKLLSMGFQPETR